MTLRYWTDPRDGGEWTVWLELGGPRPILAFSAGDDLHTVVLDFTDGLEDRSDVDLQRLLDEGRG